MLFLIPFAGVSQQSLPDITVKSFNNKVIVSWLNDYEKPISNILIQRSFDSLKNFSTIGSVLIPQNKENGYPDNNPPYNKMFYRVCINFENGEYVIGPSVRPTKQPKIIPAINITDTSVKIITKELFWQPLEVKAPPKKEEVDSIRKIILNDSIRKINVPDSIKRRKILLHDSIAVVIPKVVIEKPITYPSSTIFTNKQNSITIHLPDVSKNRYFVRFYDENDNFLFQLNKLNEEYLIIEKVNFGHSGWFNFELYENGKSIEKNKFFISKDSKTSNK